MKRLGIKGGKRKKSYLRFQQAQMRRGIIKRLKANKRNEQRSGAVATSV